MKLGFIECPSGVITKPQSLVCYKILSNEVGAPEARGRGEFPLFCILNMQEHRGQIVPFEICIKKIFFQICSTINLYNLDHH